MEDRGNSRYLILVVVAALAGALFAAVSTHDFSNHLDRQVHPVTCSFIPGIGLPDTTGSSGCYAALMSPYSSLLRATVWGGIPIALLGLSVFVFLGLRAAEMLLGEGHGDPDETRFLAVASLLPFLTSALYLYLAVSRVGALCKLCIGIYVASALVLVFSMLAHARARAERGTGLAAGRDGQRSPRPRGRFALYFLEGVLVVLLPVLAYLGFKPAYGEELSRCGELARPEDRYGVRVALGGTAAGVPAIEVIDPLCPACKAFKDRLDASGLDRRLQLEGVLFPLDKECNWMVGESLHPGACRVSEAVLCAGPRAAEVVAWSLANNVELRRLGATDPGQVVARVSAAFPALASCLGQPEVRSRLNKSLRWVVSNSLPVLTPQLYVRGRKLCDEDTDLGLEYSLSRLLDQAPAAPRPEGRR